MGLIITVTVIAVVIGSATAAAAGGCYGSIASFGASLSDTGNSMRSHGDVKVCQACSSPYGETYFGRPTGRYSDGRIWLDFLAEGLGLPFVPPFLGGSSDNFHKGVNFAVGGATALDSSFFIKKGFPLDYGWTNYSLGVQMKWFKQLLPSLCSSHSDCDIFRESLFIVGEFGLNDYIYPIRARTSMKEIRQTFVPKVIDAISSAITDLIELGAMMLLVPGIYPIGCNPASLTIYLNKSEDDYDPNTGCIKSLNKFVEYHNEKLSEELDSIRQVHPFTTIIYFDFYTATLDMLQSPTYYGFGASSPLVACCGGGGPYNYNSSALCGTKNAKVCPDTSRYIFWDHIHFTEAANKIITNGLLNGRFTYPPFNKRTCPSLGQKLTKVTAIM